MFGLTLGIAGTFPFQLPVDLSLVGGDTPLTLLFLDVGFSLSLMLIPLSIGVAVLRSHLFDIDLLINRTLVYGSLTAMLRTLLRRHRGVAGLFVALTSEQSTLAVVASTLLIAALFNPLRRRIQSFIDRRFYRRKYDARKTLEAFSIKLRDETDLDALSDDLVGVVRETMQPAHVSLWLETRRYQDEDSYTRLFVWAVAISLVLCAHALAFVSRPEAQLYVYWIEATLIVPTFATLGALIVSRRPGNIIGWLFLVSAVAGGMQFFSGQYATVALSGSTRLPGGAYAAWLSTLMQFAAVSTTLFLILLFPTGRLLSPRWRVVAGTTGLVILGSLISLALSPGPIQDFAPTPNPFGVRVVVPGFLQTLGGWLVLACIVAVVVSPRLAVLSFQGRRAVAAQVVCLRRHARNTGDQSRRSRSGAFGRMG